MQTEVLHVVPINDIIVHITDMCCECIPKVDEKEPNLIVHNRVGLIHYDPEQPGNA